MFDIEKEREPFEAWAFQNIENFIDVRREHKYYVMKSHSRLSKQDKEFLVLSSNRGWASWQASTLRAEEKLEGCVVVPKTIPENVVKMLECSGYHWGDGTRDYFTPLYSMIVEEAARGGK